MTTVEVSPMRSHHSGFPEGEDLLRLHCNENPYGPPPGVLRAVEEQMRDWCTAYPDSDCADLRARIANYRGVSADQVVTGNGVDEIILLTALTLLSAGERVVVTDTSFPGYAAASTTAGAVVDRVPLRDYRIPVDEVIERLPGAKMVFLCTPHNPTGTLLSAKELDTVLRAAADADVIPVIDEAYLEFAGEDAVSALDSLRAGARVIVLRTFSKAWGLASLRAGYAIGPTDLISAIRTTHQALPFSMNRAAQAAASAALAEPEHLAETVRRNAIARERLCAGLEELGISYVPSASNFVLFTVPDTTELAAQLANRYRIVVRDLTSFGLPEHIRVTVGTESDVEQFLAALGGLLAERERATQARIELSSGLGSAHRDITFTERVPVPPNDLFNGYVGAHVVFALGELGVWLTLRDGERLGLRTLAEHSGARVDRLLPLVRVAALLGYLELSGIGADTQVRITSAGHEIVARRGFFTWGIGGYGGMLRELSALTTGQSVFDTEGSRDGAFVAKGSGDVGRELMVPVEADVLSGVDFGTVADLGCGDATRLIRLCRMGSESRGGLGIETNELACGVARQRIAEAGMAGQLRVDHADVAADLGSTTFDGVDMVSCFLMLHDLFNVAGDPVQVMQSLRKVFPDARYFLIGDTVAQDWSAMSELPIFSLEFELVHAFMDTSIIGRDVYENAFAKAGLSVVRREAMGAPSTWLWLLSPM